MSDEMRRLGGRLPLLDPATRGTAYRAVYDRIDARVARYAEGAGFPKQGRGWQAHRTIQPALGEKGLVDLIALAGCYQIVCSPPNAFAIPAPGPTA